jgi:F-type H+-transporting ATPase subunit delta
MKISKQARREAKELFRRCLTDGLLDEGRARQVVTRVLQIRPRGYLAILSHFQHLVKLHLEERTARIESPVPLDDRQKAAITAQLSQRYGSGLIFAFQENPGLIGGLRVRVGSDVIDGSVRGRLAALEQSF